MSLSTTQYGYIIDPLVPLTDDTGRTISNGYIRVFMVGTSTSVITYKNFDGATNEETVQLDNSGRTAYPVIGSKGSTYKVCVYDAEHSQENPIKTVDKVVPIGASVNALNVVQGLNAVEGSGWVKATVTGGDTALVEMDPSSATEVGLSDFPLHDQDTYGVFLDSDGNPYKILLGNISSSVFLGSEGTMSRVYQLVTAGYDVSISVVDPNDNKNIITLHLATKRSDGMDRTMTFSSVPYRRDSKNWYYHLQAFSYNAGSTWATYGGEREI